MFYFHDTLVNELFLHNTINSFVAVSALTEMKLQGGLEDPFGQQVQTCYQLMLTLTAKVPFKEIILYVKSHLVVA